MVPLYQVFRPKNGHERIDYVGVGNMEHEGVIEMMICEYCDDEYDDEYSCGWCGIVACGACFECECD